jgi:hypothetical protein
LVELSKSVGLVRREGEPASVPSIRLGRWERKKEPKMRVLVLVKEDERSEAGELPPAELFIEMNKFNEQLLNAGVMLAADGLAPSSKGKRVAFDVDGSTTVKDGPFTEAKELVAGFWIWQVSSMDEAVEWIKRAPFGGGVTIELRPVFEAEDFGKEFTPELRERESRLREEIGRQRAGSR